MAFAAVLETRGVGPARFLDLGSGGGIPGLVLAARWPNIPGTLLEVSVRRSAFLRTTLQGLGWETRVTVAEGRAELLARNPELRPRSFGGRALVCGARRHRRDRRRVREGRRRLGGERTQRAERRNRPLARRAPGTTRPRPRRGASGSRSASRGLGPRRPVGRPVAACRRHPHQTTALVGVSTVGLPAVPGNVPRGTRARGSGPPSGEGPMGAAAPVSGLGRESPEIPGVPPYRRPRPATRGDHLPVPTKDPGAALAIGFHPGKANADPGPRRRDFEVLGGGIRQDPGRSRRAENWAASNEAVVNRARGALLLPRGPVRTGTIPERPSRTSNRTIDESRAGRRFG